MFVVKLYVRLQHSCNLETTHQDVAMPPLGTPNDLLWKNGSLWTDAVLGMFMR